MTMMKRIIAANQDSTASPSHGEVWGGVHLAQGHFNTRPTSCCRGDINHRVGQLWSWSQSHQSDSSLASSDLHLKSSFVPPSWLQSVNESWVGASGETPQEAMVVSQTRATFSFVCTEHDPIVPPSNCSKRGREHQSSAVWPEVCLILFSVDLWPVITGGLLLLIFEMCLPRMLPGAIKHRLSPALPPGRRGIER